MSHTCPICGLEQHCDLPAFEHHVNSHLDGGKGPANDWTTDLGAFADDDQISGLLKDGQQEAAAVCPLCQIPFDDLSAMERDRHVNVCMDEDLSRAESSTPFIQRRPTRTPSDRVRGHVAEGSGRQVEHDEGDDNYHQDFDDDFHVASGPGSGPGGEQRWAWDGPARPSASTEWKKKERGDSWWDPVDGSLKGSDIPHNFAPGVTYVLQKILEASVQEGTTKRAVLGRDVTNIRGVWGFDMGWACGHRNTLMMISSLVQHSSDFRRAFSREANGSDPGVRRVQGWIEDAWADGFDEDGKTQLGGKVLGGRKWIGTSDVAALFSYKGIPCDLYDFPRAASGSTRLPPARLLVEWVMQYFNEGIATQADPPQPITNAFDVLMQSKSDNIRRSDRYPLILQHAGHSRTIVGYEETFKGDVHLLVYDPGKTDMPSDIRAAGIAHLAATRASTPTMTAPPHLTRPPSVPRISLSNRSSRVSASSHESLPFSRPFTNGASEQVEWQDSLSSPIATAHSGATRHLNLAGGAGGTGAGVNISEEGEDDEVVDERGWVRKRLSKIKSAELAPGKVLKKVRPDASNKLDDGEKGKGKDKWANANKRLGYFRASLSTPVGRAAEYQVLAFPSDVQLNMAQRERRKVLSSTVIS